MRISINKLTGKMIESQSGGETHPNPEINDEEYALANLATLRQNAINAGYTEEDIEVKFVTDEEFAEIMMVINEPIKQKREKQIELNKQTIKDIKKSWNEAATIEEKIEIIGDLLGLGKNSNFESKLTLLNPLDSLEITGWSNKNVYGD